MKEEVLNALRNLPEGQNALWILFETKNLYKWFESMGTDVDEIYIPNSNDHPLRDTLENLFEMATQIIARIMNFGEETYPLYDFLFCQVKVDHTPFELGKSQYWVVTIDNVEHMIYWRN